MVKIIKYPTQRLYKDGDFLYQKYVLEGLSITQVADLTFSSAKTIRKYLSEHGVGLRAEDRRGPGSIKFGERRSCRRIVQHEGELRTMSLMIKLRKEGLSYSRIATRLNDLGIPTKTRVTTWYPKTVRQVLLRGNS